MKSNYPSQSEVFVSSIPTFIVPSSPTYLPSKLPMLEVPYPVQLSRLLDN